MQSFQTTSFLRKLCAVETETMKAIAATFSFAINATTLFLGQMAQRFLHNITPAHSGTIYIFVHQSDIPMIGDFSCAFALIV